MMDNKDKVYEEIGPNYRFFLAWRRAAFAGGLVLLWGTCSLLTYAYKEGLPVAWLIPSLAALAAFCLWVVDKRTRQIYRALTEAGKALEENNPGPYHALTDVGIPSDAPWLPRKGEPRCKLFCQSFALDCFFLGSALILFAVAFFVLLRPPSVENRSQTVPKDGSQARVITASPPVPKLGVDDKGGRMSSGTQFWGNVAQWVSAIATAAGFTLAILAVYWRYRVERALNFDRRYKEHRRFIRTFWKLLRPAWEKYQKSHSEFPLKVDDFIRKVGIPPRMPPETSDIRKWRADNEQRLNADQKGMLEFVSIIYPERKGPKTGDDYLCSLFKDKKDADAFDKARGELAWFWETEARLVGNKYLSKYHSSARDMLIQIAWLEIALHERVDISGLGMIRLFTILRTIWRTHS